MPFPATGLGQVAFVALWLVGALALLAVGSSLSRRLLPTGSPMAAPLGLPLALALFWVVSFWLGHALPLPLVGVLGVALLLGLAGWAHRRRENATPLLPPGFRAAALVFGVAFLVLVVVRLLDPAVHPSGGEKFLDFGLLKSLLRSSTLPPEDMWFAGEPVSYYYGGHLLVSQLARLTATPPEYAYNLALAGFYAMLVTVAYGLAAGIADRVDVSSRLAGGFAAFFVGFASNLATPLNLLAVLLPGDLATSVASAMGFQLEGLATGVDRFSYWTASRVIEGTINEFPLFAWLNGDMHAHMMQTSFTLLAAGLLAGYAWTPPEQVRRRRLILVGILPALAGMAAVVNTWSFPTVAGLTLLGVYLADARPQALLPGSLAERLSFDAVLPEELARLGLAVGLAALVGLGGLLWSAPFWLESATSRPLGLFPERSPLGGLLVVHGVFLLLFATYLLRMAGARAADARRGAVLAVLVLGLGAAAGMLGPALLLGLIVLGWFVMRTDALDDRLPERSGLLGTSPATDGGAAAEQRDGDGEGRRGESARTTGGLPRPSFETVLIVAGLGLVLLVEFAHVDEGGALPRLNTVFKVYMQVWVLLGTAAGVVLARLVADHDPGLPLSGRAWRRRFAALAAVLVVLTSIYGVLALTDHAEGTVLDRTEGLTLDATAFVGDAHPEEAPAIDWIDRLDGQPTIVTAAPGGYTWRPSEGKGASAPASLTGVPTVLGWFHEAQYRGEDVYRPRRDAVHTIYTGDVAGQTEHLRQFDVEFVYVGPAERNRYADVTIAAHPAVSVATAFEHVTIYRVDQSALGDG